MPFLFKLIRGALTFALLTSAFAHADDAAEFREMLEMHSHAVALKDGKLVGPGAELIMRDAQSTQFVSLGEEHDNYIIPDITTAIFTGRINIPNQLNSFADPLGLSMAGLIVGDFLPSPEELAFKEATVKITIALSKSSIEPFKEKADENHTAYQKMIRRLLDSYVDRHTNT